MNLRYISILCFAMLRLDAQVTDTLLNKIDTLSVFQDTIPILIPDNEIQNSSVLNPFFDKLKAIATNKTKVRVVHIGDSHIQADAMTGRIRKNLQTFFGNAGRGFVFPYTLARTNGAGDCRFSSNASWSALRNISVPNGSKVGLSGIALATKKDNFYINMNVKDIENYFNTIKIITPNNEKSFTFSVEKKIIATEIRVPKKISHKIRKRETISTIADKYNISEKELKAYNNLKNNKIRYGRTLKIPTNETVVKRAEKSEFVPLESIDNQNYFSYQSVNPLSEIYIIPTSNKENYNLNGLILENNNEGVIYNSIGVNGAKCYDYNKYPLFFDQLKALEPDLCIISLGTNESFDKMTTENYIYQLKEMLSNIRKTNPNVVILVSTPPPSLFNRRNPNRIVEDYAQKIKSIATENNVAVWDLYAQMGGVNGCYRNSNKGILNTDKVHYTRLGYEIQGDLLSEALQKTYNQYINSQKK